MSKKILSLAIALVLMLAIAPTTALGASVTVSVPQTVYAEGQRIYVTVTGVTDDLIQKYCWVAVYDAGGGTSAYHEWKHVTTVGTSTIPLDLPLQQGKFEIRFVPQSFAAGGHSAVSQTISVVFEPPETIGIGDYLWTGEWDTTWGKMTLTQNGRNVTGNYVHDQGKIEGKVYGNVLVGKWSEYPTYGPDDDDAGLYLFRMSEDGKSFVGGWCYKYEHPSYWSAWAGKSGRLTEVLPVTVETPPAQQEPDPPAQQEPDPPAQQSSFDAANWAIPELEKAQAYGIIPDSLKDVDYKKPITRTEFAAVSVKLYENLSGKTATPIANNPFTDTNDVEVLKAYNIGLTTGTSATAFSPNSLLTREQAATMLTRAIKAAYIPSWTLASDDSYTLNFAQPAKFADDGKINAWAKQSVYYANAKGIILGTGNEMFSPEANAARQEALTIAVRMVEKLKGVAVDYTKGE